MLNKFKIIIPVIILIFGIFILIKWKISSKNIEQDLDKISAVLYKSPSCGCCIKHAQYLKNEGFDVEIKPTNNMQEIKDRYNIPGDVESCHTTVIGDYFFEGHLPVEAINKVLEEKPQINGIALPNMPAGSPGMPGVKQKPFEIFSVTDGDSHIFLEI